MSEDTQQLIDSNLVVIYTRATMLARQNSQTIHEKNDYYITLEQLEILINGMQEQNEEEKI